MDDDQVIGRTSEKEILQSALNSDEAQLLAIYGRRRVGKTYLIRQFYRSYIKFEISGLHNGSMSDQLEHFISGLLKCEPSLEVKSTVSWLHAFALLEQYLDNLKGPKKKVVFIDEFPWFATPRSKFLMAFENFWNTYASRRKDLIVVICGSAASWMIQKVVKNKGGLHNRVSKRIRLLPFTLSETEKFLRSRDVTLSRYDIIQLYMVIGGVPHYLKEITKGESIAQFVDRVCFAKDGLLTDEFQNLFASLFENEQRHIAIVHALASKRTGLTRDEIIKLSGSKSGGGLTRTLDELMESGFVEQYFPFDKNKKLSLYRLNDEFSLFHLKYLHQSKTRGAGSWLKLSNTQGWKAWSGFAFEGICLKHIRRIELALGINLIRTEISAWRGKSDGQIVQLDLLIDRDDNIINVCEMKFSKSEFVIDKKYARELQTKLEVFKNATGTRKNLFLTMVTTYGVRKNEYALQWVQHVLTMDMLFGKLYLAKTY